jgi:hypothetical protein
MGALEVLSGIATAPSSTPTGLTMQGSDSLTVKNANKQPPDDHAALLIQVWALQQTAGILRIRSPSLHDQTQGIRLRPRAADPVPLLPWGVPQRLFPQDTLTVDITGSATAGDIEAASLLVYYPDLPGQVARLFTPEEVLSRIRNIVTIENTISTGTAGDYSGSEAINAEFDLLKANTDYAILGYEVASAAACVIGWTAPDWANLRIGAPGNITKQELTKDWFILLSRAYGLPLIPVFSSGNVGNVTIDALVDENGGDPVVQTIIAELGPAPDRKSGLKK